MTFSTKPSRNALSFQQLIIGESDSGRAQNSDLGPVGANGRLYHFLDEGIFFDQEGSVEKWFWVARDDPLTVLDGATGQNLHGGEGHLLVSDGKKLAERKLPACPVFEGRSAGGGKLVAPMVNGEVACWEVGECPIAGSV